MRARGVRMSVPFPTPDGPVITNTRDTREKLRRLPAEHLHQLAALALREPADGLARRDAADVEDLPDLHPPVLGYREEHVEDLRRLDVFRWMEEQVVHGDPPRLEVALELGARRADLVGALQRIHALNERSLGCPGVLHLFCRLHGRRVYPRRKATQDESGEKGSSSRRGRETLSRPEAKPAVCRRNDINGVPFRDPRPGLRAGQAGARSTRAWSSWRERTGGSA